MTSQSEPANYHRFSLDTPPEVCKQIFIKRYGYEPELVFPIIYSHWPGQRPWGDMCAGPVKNENQTPEDIVHQ